MIDAAKLKELAEKATKAPWKLSVGFRGATRSAFLSRGPDEDGLWFGDRRTDESDIALIVELRNSLPAILALVEREAEMQKRLDDVIADYLDGRREVDKALKEFGYDDIRFADVRHGWLFSTNRIKEWPEVEKAFEAYDMQAWKKEQELAKAAMGGEGARQSDTPSQAPPQYPNHPAPADR